jgi:hypothetical protein
MPSPITLSSPRPLLLRLSPRSDDGAIIQNGIVRVTNDRFGSGVVSAELDLDGTPRTLRFFHNGQEQRYSVTHVPTPVSFALSLKHPRDAVSATLRQVSGLVGGGRRDSVSFDYTIPFSSREPPCQAVDTP